MNFQTEKIGRKEATQRILIILHGYLIKLNQSRALCFIRKRQ
jgi:hypothetical protein